MRYISSLLLVVVISAAFAQPIEIRNIETSGHGVITMDVCPIDNMLVTGGDDNMVKGWNPKTGVNTFNLSGHSDFVTSVKFSSPNNEGLVYLASGSKSGSVIIHNYDKKSLYFQEKIHSKTINDILFIESYNLVITAGGDGNVGVIDLNSKTFQVLTASETDILSLGFIPELNFFSTSDATGTIKLWNPASRNLEMVIEDRKGFVRDQAVLENRLITVGDDKVINLREGTNGNMIKGLEKAHKKWIQIVTALSDQKHFATGGHDGIVTMWTSELTEVFSVKQGGSFVSGISANKELTEMYTSGYGVGIKVWDLSGYDFSPLKQIPSAIAINSSGRSSTPPSSGMVVQEGINLVQPYLKAGNTFYYAEEELSLKGEVFMEGGISELVLYHKEKSTEERIKIENQRFEHPVKLGYFDNNLELRLTSKSGKIINKKLMIHRIFDENNSEEVVKLTRNGRDYALIFATNEYTEINDLTNPVFDATTIANELKLNYGFEVELIINPSLDEIKLKIKEYSKRLFADEDQLFMFIAGHGEYDDFFKEGYIVATDSKAKDEARSSYLPHSTLRTYVNNIPCNHIFLVMDVCFGGTFDPIIAKRGNESIDEQARRVQLIKRKLKYKTRFYLTSGGKEYVPDGRPGHHSPFARKLIESLRTYGGVDKILTSKEIISNVESVTPEPRFGEFGDNEPGSDFLFIAPF